MAQDLYEEPKEEISQGDILELVPHIYLDPPLSVLKPENDSYRTEREPFSQFDDVNGQRIVAMAKRYRAIVITHDCEIDKTKRWHICPVVSLDRLNSGLQGDVKRNRVFKRFFLPRYADVLPAALLISATFPLWNCHLSKMQNEYCL